MHAAVQSGGRSPKRLNGASVAQQKSSSDGTQNCGPSKGKKRDRAEQGNDPAKRDRDRPIEVEESEHGNLKVENMKSEIAKITEKSGLPHVEAVERLVHLMQLDRTERQIDFAGRVMLADIIAATESPDCLVRFVQLRGLPLLDDWLQEVHKGKSGEGSSPKETDKPIEEFIFALLCALAKLPINLHALQSCSIGKSVNHLRSHKNLEIQKKAKCLVENWKKRVDAEMKSNDVKATVSSQAAPFPEFDGRVSRYSYEDAQSLLDQQLRQVRARAKVLHRRSVEREDTEVESLKTDLEASRAIIKDKDAEIERLRKEADDLRSANAAVTSSNQDLAERVNSLHLLCEDACSHIHRQVEGILQGVGGDARPLSEVFTVEGFFEWLKMELKDFLEVQKRASDFTALTSFNGLLSMLEKRSCDHFALLGRRSFTGYEDAAKDPSDAANVVANRLVREWWQTFGREIARQDAANRLAQARGDLRKEDGAVEPSTAMELAATSEAPGPSQIPGGSSLSHTSH